MVLCSANSFFHGIRFRSVLVACYSLCQEIAFSGSGTTWLFGIYYYLYKQETVGGCQKNNTTANSNPRFPAINPITHTESCLYSGQNCVKSADSYKPKKLCPLSTGLPITITIIPRASKKRIQNPKANLNENQKRIGVINTSNPRQTQIMFRLSRCSSLTSVLTRRPCPSSKRLPRQALRCTASGVTSNIFVTPSIIGDVSYPSLRSLSTASKEEIEGSSYAPRPFNKLLAANRGEIATRILRAGTELGCSTVALYSHEGREILALTVCYYLPY
jgi:hypothetical protein